MDALQMAGIAVVIALVGGLTAYIATQRETGRFLLAAFVGASIGGGGGFYLASAATMLLFPHLDSAVVGFAIIFGAAFAGAVLGGYGGAAYVAIKGPERKSAVAGAIVGLKAALLLALLALAVFFADISWWPATFVAAGVLCLLWLGGCIGILAGARIGAVRSKGPPPTSQTP